MPAERSFRIAAIGSVADLADAVALCRAYAASLDTDLSYQGFEAEMQAMPGQYAPPRGALLLARDGGGGALGCVCLRPLPAEGCCEMKRLYVVPAARGIGLGEALVAAVLRAASRIGYREMRLDTLPSMAGAQALYRRFGFEPMPPYYDTPVAGTVFLRRPLSFRSTAGPAARP